MTTKKATAKAEPITVAPVKAAEVSVAIAPFELNASEKETFKKMLDIACAGVADPSIKVLAIKLRKQL